MSEHPLIDEEGFQKLLAQTAEPISADDQERVNNHLMYGLDHIDQGFDVLYGNLGDLDLNAKFRIETLAHYAAILRGDISPLDIWQGEL